MGNPGLEDFGWISVASPCQVTVCKDESASARQPTRPPVQFLKDFGLRWILIHGNFEHPLLLLGILSQELVSLSRFPQRTSRRERGKTFFFFVHCCKSITGAWCEGGDIVPVCVAEVWLTQHWRTLFREMGNPGMSSTEERS